MQRALRIVLMRDRRTEQRHRCIANELFDRATETLELRTQPLVIGSEQRSYVLGIHALGTRGEAHQVRKQHGHDLALLTRGRLRTGKRPSAGVTESSAVWVLLATTWTGDHGRIVRRRLLALYSRLCKLPKRGLAEASPRSNAEPR